MIPRLHPAARSGPPSVGRSSLARWSVVVLGACLGLATGCYQQTIINDPDGAPPPWDAAAYLDAGTDAFVPPDTKCVEASGVDLLFVVDNSNSMAEEQANLAARLPDLVTALIMPPDRDGDLEPDWLPARDLRVAVTTVDMGTGGFTVPTCANAQFGDDGILRTIGNTEIPGCSMMVPRFLEFDPAGATTPSEFASQVSCVTSVGTGGCGFEQQLEATLKAISPNAPTAATGPAYAPPAFFMDTRGHALDANAGFVRDDSLLAVVLVTDEDDCSASDPELYNMASSVYTADPNLRCAVYPEAMHPVSRYVDGLAGLRALRPDLFAFAVIAGVPPDLAVERPTDAEYAALLADPRMIPMPDPANPQRLVTSCNEAGTGLAFPPQRIVQVARGLGGYRTTIQSLCQDDFTDVSAALARLFGERACTMRQD
ncbi:MAG: hypothetical protein AB7S26_33440 [Sandaracinaceae bacterium]